MGRKIIISIIVASVCVLMVHSLAPFIHRTIFSADIKGFAEKKVSSFFDAQVRIGKINFGLLKDVSLTGLEVSRQLREKLFYLVNIKRIVFKYDWRNLLKGKITDPSKVLLYAPSLKFRQFKIPYTLFGHGVFGVHNKLLLEVHDGTIGYDLAALKTNFMIEHIDGTVAPSEDGGVSVAFEGSGGGDIGGQLSIEGMFHQVRKTCDASVLLHDISVVPQASFAPLRKLSGTVRVTNEVLTFENVSFFIRDVFVSVNGTVSNFMSDPIVDLRFSANATYASSEFAVFGVTSALQIKGTFSFNEQEYPYAGYIMFGENEIVIKDMEINGDYAAHGTFVLDTGEYTISFVKDNQEVTMHLSHDDYNVQLDLNLKHITFLGYDFVTVGRMSLEPNISFWRDNRFMLDGRIETDYMIFNYAPLDDFKGKFTVSFDALSNIDVSWGESYSAQGTVLFGEEKTVDGELIITSLDLQRNESFCGYMIPKDIEAIVDSQVHFDGKLPNPQVKGFVRSGPGRFQALDFKKVKIDFAGDTHMLKLDDSKIFRSGSIFSIRGSVDFNKSNIFHDLVVESDEKVILWRGWDLSKKVEEESLQLKKKVTDNLDLSVEGTFRGRTAEDESLNEGAVSLEYSYTDDQSISVSFEEDEDSMVSLKHAITF